ncbi:thermonuclease family protein [Methylobacterium sp. Leaf456]|uniref:thermonuclease family protein n=1 Tax=Methylobacterium sp. Leaf456 TaxID=1736382 RepID=UPI00336AD2B2
MRLALALMLLTAPAGAAEFVTGRAAVVDGDTLDIRGQRFRLQGVDTPESAQICQDARRRAYRCGQKAALALADKIGAGTVTCEAVESDRYGRTVAVCRLGSLDLNGWLVEQGLGLAYRRYSTAYVAQEDAARAAKRGLWAGTFTPPWDWRKGERSGPEGQVGGAAAPAPPAASLGTCAIKGNISRKGERIYHLPGTRDYARTQISTKAGERMFCSEAEAQASGWRASRG